MKKLSTKVKKQSDFKKVYGEKKYIDERPRCEECEKLATRNIQECWVEWSINKKGEFSEEPTDIRETNGDNYFLCDNCD